MRAAAGRVSLADYLRFLELHKYHHIRQMPDMDPSAPAAPGR